MDLTAYAPINNPDLNFQVHSDSAIEVVSPTEVKLPAVTLIDGVLTTRNDMGGKITFAGVNIDPSATAVGFDPQVATDYGTIANNSTQPALTILKTGTSTWILDGELGGDTGAGNVTWEVEQGMLLIADPASLGGRPVVMAGGTLRFGAAPIVNPGFEDPVLARWQPAPPR